MEYRTLGRTGLSVSVLGIGGWQLAGPLTLDGRPDGFPDPGADAAVALLHAARDAGINFVDTAPIYGDGEGERRVGRALQGERDRWLVATKFGVLRGPGGERRIDPSPGALRQSLEGSLRRLGTDHVDVLLYHAPPGSADVETGREELERLREAGKLRFYGVSTRDVRVLRRLVEADSVQVVLLAQSLARQPQALLDVAEQARLGVVVHGALERGLLSDRWHVRAPVLSADDVRSVQGVAAELARYAVYRRFATRDRPLSVLALRYLLDRATTDTVLVGARSRSQLTEALRAVDASPLDPALDRALARVRRYLTEGGPARRTWRRASGLVRRLLRVA